MLGRFPLHLSHDLSRFGYVKIFVWLTHPTTSLSSERLLETYKEKVLSYRDRYQWNVDPSGSKFGQGVGKKEKRATGDQVALNHLELAYYLEFIRRESNTWIKNGLILSSREIDNAGRPLFFESGFLEKRFQEPGLVALMRDGERLIFACSVLTADIDGMLPLLRSIDGAASTEEVTYRYFDNVSQWYQEKGKVEPSLTKAREWNQNSRHFREKFEDLERQTKAQAESKPTLVHCQEQVSPRLHYLRALGLIEGKEALSLTTVGGVLKSCFLSKEALPKLLNDELSVRARVVEIYSVGLPECDLEKFTEAFDVTARFYMLCGSILLSYDNLYLALASRSIDIGCALSLNTYDKYLDRLSQMRKVTYSTVTPTRRYVKVLR